LRVFKRYLLQFGILDAERNQSDPFGLFPGERFAGEKIVFHLGETAQQRPNDAGDVTRCDAEPGVAVHDPCGPPTDRHVSQNANYKTGSDRNTVDRRNDRLVAVDDVVDEILGLFPGRHACHGIIKNALDQLEIAAGGKCLPCARYDDRVDVGIIVDIAPDIGELGMRFGIDRIIGFRPVEGQPQYALRGIVGLEPGVGGVMIGHGTPYAVHSRAACACRYQLFLTDVRI
jgi:hypothetical protein